MNLNDPTLLRTDSYVNGAWTKAKGDKRFAVTNPANGAVIAEVADLGAAEVTAAIDAAVPAQKEWAARTAKDRAMVLRKWYDLIMANADDLAIILTTEMGKPLAEARGEVAYGASFIDWFGEEARRVCGDVMESPIPDKRFLTFKQPIGVFGAITPWNFPIAMITRKVAPGIAAGCACVLKPAEQTPLSALALAELAHRAGLPAGVMNIVTGMDAPAMGSALCDDDRIRKMTFTGSTEVGRILMRQSADTLKKMSLELGGNAPLIVFDDADLDLAIAGAMASKYRNAGQTCVCANRLFVQDGIYDEFARRLTEASAAMKVGDGLEEGVEQGPIIDDQGLAKVERHVADAIAKGATVLTGGKRHALGGTFYEPTVLTGMSSDMQMYGEETFGPVAGLFRFSTDDEAVAMANDTEFGLAAYIFTDSTSRLFRVSEALEYGMVSANTGIFSSEVGPFGGVKSSGLGREGSKYGIDEFLEIKFVCVGI
ncbi:MAG: Succinate-semialdehyde dehydrogenase [NADP(+)] GabD [SAR116 cluster bacterium]|nr:succinate-semialdehyde dehydrogenase (NADP(+)) [SAR116 cluster bacterium]MEC8661296.1 NAD-dependent succinate-semialdehyde dehydrogenase [Pseudomonadota bacterium]CAI8216014.1 MAG: Succinate-semialdehyde dehydrogenase [NADP(+)] GabD [SAR116 cluster bacterium]|tara:strand:+ start:4688 stop:6139 length:1452 start_codon:yes stop_codon:yes gene_type:complete